jgi:hypothetical protein
MWVLIILFLLAIVLPITLIIVGIKSMFLSAIAKKRKGFILILIGVLILMISYHYFQNTRIFGC